MSTVKHLLPQVPRYFKTNLHTHSTISDGRLTREEVKKAYKELGYQILCLTDHNTIANHSDMNDPDFLMLTGIEISVNSPDKRACGRQTYHLNLIAKRPDILWTPRRVFGKFPEAAPYEAQMECENMKLPYSPETVNALIEKANEKGFLVTYNHPTWSCQTYADYAPLKGVWGMEVRNSECCHLGYDENNFRVYRDLLTLGNRVFPLGTDDMHKPRALGQSWIMVGAPELEYGCVIDTLEKGDFYMSCGPEINDLWVEGNVLKVSCSEAKRINFATQARLAQVAFAEGEPLRGAEFPLDQFFECNEGDSNAFVYLTITAEDGSYAVTRAYYLNELQ